MRPVPDSITSEMLNATNATAEIAARRRRSPLSRKALQLKPAAVGRPRSGCRSRSAHSWLGGAGSSPVVRANCLKKRGTVCRRGPARPLRPGRRVGGSSGGSAGTGRRRSGNEDRSWGMEGMRLGLSLIRDIIFAHQTDPILEESGPAQTAFTLSLPPARPDENEGRRR